MARTIRIILAALVVPAIAAAQGKPMVEVGTHLGVTIQSVSGSSLTHFGAPGQGILGQPTIYATVFAGDALMLEPQVALNIISGGGSTVTSVGLGADIGYLLKGPTTNSPFIAASGAFQSVSGGGSSTSDEAVGAKVGYRILIGSSVGVRVEAGYRRWFDSDINEITAGIGIGGVIHSTR